MHLISILILPIVMIAGALHFLLLGLCHLFKLDKAASITWGHLYALDIYANSLLGGDPRETISSRLGRGQIEGCLLCGLLCKFLNIFDADHCRKAAITFKSSENDK